MKTILIISYSSLHTDPRILRQVQALKNDYKIATIGLTRIKDDSILFYPFKSSHKKSLSQKLLYLLPLLFNKLIYILLLLLNRKKYIEKSLKERLNPDKIFSYNIKQPDVIIANDWDGLYMASVLKSKYSWKANIYYDAHEYSPNQFSASIIWRLLRKPVIVDTIKKCKDYITVMSTVCEGIAREYEGFFGFPNGFVKIVTNAAEYQNDLKPNEIHGNKIRLIHHGGAARLRKLELMIEMMQHLNSDNYELTFMLIHPNNNYYNYYNYLVRKSKKFRNIKFIEPVSFSEIPKTLNNYDIGVYILMPESFNQKYALPNKLFEFVQARLAVAIGPSIEMVKIVDAYNLGVHSKTFSPKSLAESISNLTTEKIMQFKRNSDKYANELSAEKNLQKIRDIVKEVLAYNL